MKRKKINFVLVERGRRATDCSRFGVHGCPGGPHRLGARELLVQAMAARVNFSTTEPSI